MAKIHIYVGDKEVVHYKVEDAKFDPSKHPRAKSGQFGSGGPNLSGGKPFQSIGVINTLKGKGYEPTEPAPGAVASYKHPNGHTVHIHQEDPLKAMSAGFEHHAAGHSLPLSGVGSGTLKEILEGLHKRGELTVPPPKPKGEPTPKKAKAEPAPAPPKEEYKPNALPGVTPISSAAAFEKVLEAAVGPKYKPTWLGTNSVVLKADNGETILYDLEEGLWKASSPGFSTKVGYGIKNLQKLATGQGSLAKGDWEQGALTPTEAKAIHQVSGPSGKKSVASEPPKKTLPDSYNPDDKYGGHRYAALKDKRPPLTAAQHAAVKSYVGSGYAAINETLRHPEKYPNSFTPGNESASVKAGQEIKAYLDGAKLEESTVTWRGVKGSFATMLHTLARRPGSRFTDEGFLSTSTNWHKAADWGDVRLEVHSPKGTKAAPVSDIGGHTYGESSSESEILLQKGTTMEVMHYDPTLKILRVKVVAQD